MLKRILDPDGSGMAWQTALRLSAPEKTGSAPVSFLCKRVGLKPGDNGLSTQNETMNKIKDTASSLCEAEGMEFVHAEFLSQGGRRILRIYIDKEGGVSLEDCTLVSRQLGDMLDILLENSGAYTLEVSSPGLDRPLAKESDFVRFAGKKARVKVKTLINDQKTFTGTILGIEEGRLILETIKGPVQIPQANISTARLVYEFGEK